MGSFSSRTCPGERSSAMGALSAGATSDTALAPASNALWASFVATRCGTEEGDGEEDNKDSAFDVGFETAFWCGEEEEEETETEEAAVEEVVEGEGWRLCPSPFPPSSSVLFDIVALLCLPWGTIVSPT